MERLSSFGHRCSFPHQCSIEAITKVIFDEQHRIIGAAMCAPNTNELIAKAELESPLSSPCVFPISIP